MPVAFIKLTPWRLGKGTQQAVHDHDKAESFILDRIIGVKEKTYDAVNPLRGPAIPAQTVSIIRYAGMNQIDEFEVMEPKHEIMRLCAAGQSYQSGDRHPVNNSRGPGYWELSADWQRCHVIANIMEQFSLTDKQAVSAYELWMTRKWAADRGPRPGGAPVKPMHFHEIVQRMRDDYPATAKGKATWQDKLDILDAEMSEALHMDQSGRTGLSGGID